MCDPRTSYYVGGEGTPVPPEFRDRVAQAVRAVSKGSTVGPIIHSQVQPYSWVEFDVSDRGGVGSVHVTAGEFTGPPVQAADLQAFDKNNCEPPRRQVYGETVVQIYSVQPSEPFQSLSRSMRIYLPTGVLIEITVRNSGSPDVVRQKGTDTVERVGKGRPTLPLTELQLSQIAERLMAQ